MSDVGWFICGLVWGALVTMVLVAWALVCDHGCRDVRRDDEGDGDYAQGDDGGRGVFHGKR